MIRLIRFIFIGVLIFAFSHCSTSRQLRNPRPFGIYRDNIAWGGFFVKKFVINKDNTFTYRFRGDLLSDTSSGIYYLIKDTIFFKYHFNNYDSIRQSFKAIDKPVPFELIMFDNSSHMRPKKLLWKGEKMYYFHVETGKLVKTDIYQGKKREFYLELVK